MTGSWPMVVAPAAQDAPWPLSVLGLPAIAFVVEGVPGPQGSKSYKGLRHGKPVLVESSRKVKPWRERVVAAALQAKPAGWEPLAGPLVVDLVCTLPKGSTLAKWLDWHERKPDLSKLARSTEDALTTAGVWRDDAAVSDYRRLAKRFVGSCDPDALLVPGAVVRVWSVPDGLVQARRALSRSR